MSEYSKKWYPTKFGICDIWTFVTIFQLYNPYQKRKLFDWREWWLKPWCFQNQKSRPLKKKFKAEKFLALLFQSNMQIYGWHEGPHSPCWDEGMEKYCGCSRVAPGFLIPFSREVPSMVARPQAGASGISWSPTQKNWIASDVWGERRGYHSTKYLPQHYNR